MRLFYVGKDGGPDSTVTGYWLIEWKRFFSIALLKFENGSRDEFHSHAFNCVSWVLKGFLLEHRLPEEISSGYGRSYRHWPSLFPVITRRSTFHRVLSAGTTWVLTFRGPWSKQWKEFNPHTSKYSTLESGRIIVR